MALGKAVWNSSGMEKATGSGDGIGDAQRDTEAACLVQAVEEVDEILLLQAPGTVRLQSLDGLPQLP